MKLKILTICLVIGLSTAAGLYFWKAPTSFSLSSILQSLSPRNYEEILETGIQPAISPDFDFPTSYQYMNGCFAFAVNNILIYKYEEGLDLLEVEKTIEKPREILWEKEYVEAFLNEYNITMRSYKDADTFFSYLEAGEPVTVSYEYPLSDDKWVLHKVAAYSFDEEGIWVSDSLAGENIHLDYSKVFETDKKYLQYYSSTVERDPIH